MATNRQKEKVKGLRGILPFWGGLLMDYGPDMNHFDHRESIAL